MTDNFEKLEGDLSRRLKMPLRCEQDDRPGISDDRAEYKDWSNRESTPDQRRIEMHLYNFVNEHSQILHVGIGNSKLAIRFSPLVNRIVGMTVSESELRFSQSLGIKNYEVLLWNKYDKWRSGGQATFDVLVDNNPSTYACCIHHMTKMFAWYASVLHPNGAIFTDRIGLKHALRENRSLNFSTWVSIGRHFGLQATNVDGNVYLLTRNASSDRIKLLQQGHYLSRHALLLWALIDYRLGRLRSRLKKALVYSMPTWTIRLIRLKVAGSEN
jgi:hypothetical protein